MLEWESEIRIDKSEIIFMPDVLEFSKMTDAEVAKTLNKKSRILNHFSEFRDYLSRIF